MLLLSGILGTALHHTHFLHSIPHHDILRVSTFTPIDKMDAQYPVVRLVLNWYLIDFLLHAVRSMCVGIGLHSSELLTKPKQFPQDRSRW